MAQINLLPWRESLRDERKHRFLMGMLVVVAIGGASVFLADQFMRNEIGNQQARNSYMRGEIALVDAKVAEINNLQEQKRETQERMSVIQDLQGSRPVIVRVFDELVKTLPEGVYFQTIERVGDSMNIEGVAESYGKLTDLMRQLDGSDWFADPDLQIISASEDEGFSADVANRFTLDLALVTPNDHQSSEEYLQ
ncbi:MAG: PilN domain-containing protein [Gammaproteobacteria bacterium]|nr:PilN domain-containing protein [Gammaproteobacteria bacterium]